MKLPFKLRKELPHQAINSSSVRLGVFVGIRKSDATFQEIIHSLDQQAIQLLPEIQMVLLLETYYDFEELKTTVTYLRTLTDIPNYCSSIDA